MEVQKLTSRRKKVTASQTSIVDTAYDGMKISQSVESFTFQSQNIQSISTLSINVEEDESRKSILSKFLTSVNPFTTASKPTEEEQFVEETRDVATDMTAEIVSDTDFIISRLSHNRRSSVTPPKTWFSELQNTLTQAISSSSTTDTEVDWEFWGLMINDYEGIVKQHPNKFKRNLAKGLPIAIRGMMWQLMTASKSEALEEEYLELLQRSSRHEKIITRDLSRTFPGHTFFKEVGGQGQTSLFNVLKAYSIYDQDIGYCQGLPFVVGPLLLTMSEEQAFCVLVRIMFDYNFRDLYTTKMIGLQVRNYQFDQLVKELYPVVAAHLDKQDIKSTMYASQWFMTLFAYRFPLEIVFRILDIVLAEGPEAVLRFALALIKHNAETILTLDFERLIEYLKEGVLDKYINNIDQLVQDASQIPISKRKLDQWSHEYIEQVRLQSPEAIENEEIKQTNRSLIKQFHTLEHNYDILNREHIDLIQKYLLDQDKLVKQTEITEVLNQQVASFKSLLATDHTNPLEKANAELNEAYLDLEQKLLAARNLIVETKREKTTLEETIARMKCNNVQ